MKKAIVLLVIIATMFSGCAKKEVKNNEYGKVSFTVIDGFSGLPVEGVRLVIPECEKELFTDSSGKTDQTEVTVIKNENSVLKQDYGTFSVLGYKDGYNEYALFYAQIKDGQERNIKVYMFMTDTPLSSGTPLATIESPDKEWVNMLVEKYRN